MEITESMVEEATENLFNAMKDLIENGPNDEDYDRAVYWSNQCSYLIDGAMDA